MELLNTKESVATMQQSYHQPQLTSYYLNVCNCTFTFNSSLMLHLVLQLTLRQNGCSPLTKVLPSLNDSFHYYYYLSLQRETRLFQKVMKSDALWIFKLLGVGIIMKISQFAVRNSPEHINLLIKC